MLLFFMFIQISVYFMIHVFDDINSRPDFVPRDIASLKKPGWPRHNFVAFPAMQNSSIVKNDTISIFKFLLNNEIFWIAQVIK